MKILIVEDNTVNAKIIMTHLKTTPYETLLAKSGKEALSLLDSEPAIVLIIADIMMPEMDGLELLRTIKAKRSLKEIPVIMCSALSDIETVKQAAKEGCKGYIVKPVIKEHLLRKVKEVLAENREILSDSKKIMRHLGLKKNDYNEIAGDFLKMVEQMISSIEQTQARETPSGCSTENLSNLHENAVYLGAERLLDILDQSDAFDDAGDLSKDSFRDLLLRELKMVRETLTSVLQSKGNSHQ